MLIHGLIAIALLSPDGSGDGHGAGVQPARPGTRLVTPYADIDASLVSQDGSAQPDDAAKAAKEPKAKKPKKAKKKQADTVAPDEQVDYDQPVEKGEGPFVWKQHPSLRFGNVFRMDFQAKLQEDAHYSYTGATGLACPNAILPSTCNWQLHRNRVGVAGYFFKKIEYEVEYELTEQELTDKELLLGYTPKTQWKDVDLNLAYLKNAQIQAGRFKIPFSLDELTGDSHTDFAYRSLGAAYLAPSRDTGVMVHGRFWKRSLNYWTGVFQHDGDNARSKKIAGGDQTFAGRLTGKPFGKSKSAAGNLEIGTSYAWSSLSDDTSRPNGLRGRTLLTQDTYYDPVYVKGHRNRWGADADWTVGPASIRSEYTHVLDQRLDQGLGDQTLPDARARSWYLSATWILTGEPKTRPVKAANEFLRGGFGAVEVGARVERLWYDSAGSGSSSPQRNPRAENIYPNGDKALTIGVNWTLNRWVKLQFNNIREQVEDPERNPIRTGDAFWSRVIRFQFVL